MTNDPADRMREQREGMAQGAGDLHRLVDAAVAHEFDSVGFDVPWLDTVAEDRAKHSWRNNLKPVA